MSDLAQQRARHAALTAAINSLNATREAENRTFSDEEWSQLSRMEAEQDSVARTIQHLEGQERRAVAAQELEPAQQRQRLSGGAPGQARPSASPRILTATTRQMRAGDQFAGQSWMMCVRARVNAVRQQKDGTGTPMPAHEIARRDYQGRPDIVALLAAEARGFRAANEIAGAGTQSGDWGKELLDTDSQFTGDFVEYLYSKTVFDQVGFRDVPGNVTIKGQDGTATGYFIGQHKAIKLSAQDYSAVTLGKLKAAAMCAASNEILDNSHPSAYRLLLDSIVEAIAQAVDTLAWSNTAASDGVAPAGLLNGVSGTASAGGSLADLYADIGTLLTPFITAKNTTGLKFVSNKTVATQIGLLLHALTGLPVFPDISEDGGTLHKKPYLTGDNVTAEQLLLVKPSEVWKIGDSGVKVSVSTDATIEMSSAPTGAGDATPAAQTQAMVSMFQNEMTALKVVRDINWAKRRSHAVQLITGANYDGVEATA